MPKRGLRSLLVQEDAMFGFESSQQFGMFLICLGNLLTFAFAAVLARMWRQAAAEADWFKAKLEKAEDELAAVKAKKARRAGRAA